MATRGKRCFTAEEAAKFLLASSDEDDLDELFTQENLQEEIDLDGPQTDRSHQMGNLWEAVLLHLQSTDHLHLQHSA